MAYSADTFTSLEQPTLAKWNKLWDNDAFFATQVNTNFSSGTASKVRYEVLGRTVLGGTATSISVASLPARKYLKVLFYLLPSGSLNVGFRFNNDSAANYAYRYQTNNAETAVTAASTALPCTTTGAFQIYGDIDIANLSGFAKPAIARTSVMSEVASAAPVSELVWNKWANTSAQINRIDIYTTTNNFAALSEVVVLGGD